MSAVGRAAQFGASLVALPARVLGLLDGAELLLTRVLAAVDRAETAISQVEAVISRAEAAIDQVGGVLHGAEDTVREVRALTAAAALAIEEAARVSTDAGTVVVGRRAHRRDRRGDPGGLPAGAAPRGADGRPVRQPAQPRGGHGGVRLVDELPRLTHHLTENVLPILGTLDRVGPDIHDLLEVTRDLKLAIAGIPGLGHAAPPRRGKAVRQLSRVTGPAGSAG